MDAAIDYYPTGKSIFLENYSDRYYFVTDEWFVQCAFQGNNLLVGATKLENKEGEITLSADDWFPVPVMSRTTFPLFVLEGDTLLATLSDTMNDVYKIVVINLDTRRYEEYQGLDRLCTPIRFDGNIAYMLYISAYGRTIVALDIKTREVVFEYPISGIPMEWSMYKIYDGSRVISRSVRRPDNRQVREIVRVPDFKLYLEIEGDIKGVSIAQHGVFYVSEDGTHYYSTFGGETYRVNIEGDPRHDTRPVLGVHESSPDARSIWTRLLAPGQDSYFVNYRLSQQRLQKSARSQA